MKRIRLKLAILALVSSAVSAFAGDGEMIAVGEQLAGRNCTWCHGGSVQGFATAPQLAAQQPAYIVNQLRSFHDRSRDNPLSQLYMWGAAAKLDADTAQALAAYFATVEPQAASDGNEQLVEAGRQIYKEGNFEANIVPCIACHGPNAEGVRDIPRLAGLSYPYLKRKLIQWGEGYHLSAAAPMPGIAQKLSDEQIAALASYLSFVR
jgi:cytochrome c553